jgi:hypothetical protein
VPLEIAAPEDEKVPSWTEAMMAVISSAPGPLTYAELRQRMEEGPSKGRTWSEKSFYGAIGKLADRETIVRYKGHVFSVAAFERFQGDLAAGRVKDMEQAGPARQPSPLGEFMKGVIANRPTGLTSGDIIAMARRNPEFADVVAKNKSFPYNVLKGLVDKDEIVKRDGLYYPVLNADPANQGLEVPQHIKDFAASLPEGHLDMFTAGISDEYLR